MINGWVGLPGLIRWVNDLKFIFIRVHRCPSVVFRIQPRNLGSSGSFETLPEHERLLNHPHRHARSHPQLPVVARMTMRMRMTMTAWCFQTVFKRNPFQIAPADKKNTAATAAARRNCSHLL
jgi:hypothetical protein